MDNTHHTTTASRNVGSTLRLLIARIEDWKERCGKTRGRADTDRVLSEARKLFDELSDMLTETRRMRSSTLAAVTCR